MAVLRPGPAGGGLMSLDGSIEIFWAGDLRVFRLPIAQLLALEEKRDSALAEIHGRLMRGVWSLRDVTETLRLGLIGADVDARHAAKLVEEHCVDGRIEAAALVAFYALTAALDAPKAVALAKGDEPGKDRAETDPNEANASPPPLSTRPQP